MAVIKITTNELLNECNSKMRASSEKLELTFDGVYYKLNHGSENLLDVRDLWIVEKLLQGVLIGLKG